MIYFLDCNRPEWVYVGDEYDFDIMLKDGASPIRLDSPFQWDHEHGDWLPIEWAYSWNEERGYCAICDNQLRTSEVAICDECVAYAYREKCQELHQTLANVKGALG